MVVQTLSRDGRIIGIHIGADNVRSHFPSAHSTVEFLLGHLHIHCELEPEFWQSRPEIHDHRLADWLESQCHRRRRPGGDVPLTLISAGESCFRVELQRVAVPPTPSPRQSPPPPAPVPTRSNAAQSTSR